MAATVAARRAPFSFYDPALRPAAEAPKKRADNRPPEPTPEVAAYNRSCLDQEATLQAALVTFMPRFARLQREYIDVVSGDKVVSAASKNLAESDGAKRLAHIRYLLDNMGFKRTIMQVQLHEQMICALLRQIWGAEYDQKTETINAMHKIVREFMDVVIQTGRRMGKSYGVALFCAALLVAMPSFEIMVFSISKNNAEKVRVGRFMCCRAVKLTHPPGARAQMIELVRMMLPSTFMQYAETNNRTEMRFKIAGEQKMRSIQALASSDEVRPLVLRSPHARSGAGGRGLGMPHTKRYATARADAHACTENSDIAGVRAPIQTRHATQVSLRAAR